MQMRLIADYLPQQEARFSRLYNLQNAPRDDRWLYLPDQVKGKTPEQLRDHFGLEFTPSHVCDAIVQPQAKVRAWQTPTSAKPNVFETDMGGIFFQNERPL